MRINSIAKKNLVRPRCLVSLDAYRCLVTASRPKTDGPKYKIRSENGRTEMSTSSGNGKLETKKMNKGEIKITSEREMKRRPVVICTENQNVEEIKNQPRIVVKGKN